MKLSRLMAGAVLSLSLTLTGCSATSALSAVTSAVSPNKPELTAQVGAENTKQGIGLTAKQSDETKVGDVSGNAQVDTAKQGSDSTTVKDVTGGSVNASKQGSQITNGNVQAKTIVVSQSDPRSLLWAFGMGLTCILGLVMWFVPSPWKKKVKDDGSKEGADS
ncbi:hypothetical protein NOX27_24725 [Enterobacter kobei]|uniref:hypothetical protein n=1 Tax=Enterobacter kobei TaxID=208224 RepID=UPI002108F591|nr:hypothetical protein [Enterobacter kobei]MCQ4359509.1 hypothetical protein [Enterobacter kobei]HDC4630225.1 hypothetical protein [Enterobacter kobei]HDC4671407.1 hypothetical protein [Enterobacter kobei]